MIIGRLNKKKFELKSRLAGQYQGGSQRKESLQYRIKKIEELIVAYQANSTSLDLLEAQAVLNQKVGFPEQKKQILEKIETEEFKKQNNIKKNTSILCLVGPVGVGKTTFAQLLARAWKKEFFSLALGGLSDASVLVGSSESSSGNEIGQFSRALVETKTHEPVILLDEIDKLGYSFKNSSLHDCLVSILDPEQNKEALDYYLDVKLDFSHVTFVATANDLTKIPTSLRSRMLIVEIPPYTMEQKKEIAQKIIKDWFVQNEGLDQSKFKIIWETDALESLINKTQEKGVRQLKMALDITFEHSLLYWSRGETNINITSHLINQLIPQVFPNVDQEENKPNEDQNYKEQPVELVTLKKQVNNLEEKLNVGVKISLGLLLFFASIVILVICNISSKLEKFSQLTSYSNSK